ncbi:MAG: Smr/MutS family protein, partial [Clostridia bacterium]|nr:Smr/MutS family protein [Clostridia bacterium]
RGNDAKYLQDGTVTMRGDRYVIPVKSEYRSFIKGFIHDQSSSGATLFIEPEAVIEYNNDLKRALFSEAEEIRRILAELSSKISYMSDGIRYNAENLCEIDVAFARAEYSFVIGGVRPNLNENGIIVIERGRHPLIPRESVVPVSVDLGKDYNFLLITGPNTGGKTVTLKLTGLFSLFAASGLFVPASRAEISVFSGVYTDIGDEQSIEQSLSTFSSHIKNIIDILDLADGRSLVLIDEIGAGTDPEEGSALALSLIKKFLSENCFGIITTHYSKLKEFAAENDKIENASMEFDAVSLRPLYKLNVGIPGSSNAIEIAKTLGLKQDVINDAYLFLSDKSVSFERVLKKAEESRRESEKLKEELSIIKTKEQAGLRKIEEERARITAEREKIAESAKREVKRIVGERLEEAEEIINELKKILREAGLESKEIFRAGELKNRLKNSKYLSDYDGEKPFVLKPAKENELIKGNTVYVKSLDCGAKIDEYKAGKKEITVLIGNAKTVIKLSDAYNVSAPEKNSTEVIKVSRNTDFKATKNEINVVGLDSIEALDKVADFLDAAVVSNIAEVKIIHGLGEGILKKEIRSYLKKEKTVKEFRRGNYGEGGDGVTIVTLK